MKAPEFTKLDADFLASSVNDSGEVLIDDYPESIIFDMQVVQEAYRYGFDTARDDVLVAIDMLKNYVAMEHVEGWQEALTELESYIFSSLDLKDWYNSE